MEYLLLSFIIIIIVVIVIHERINKIEMKTVTVFDEIRNWKLGTSHMFVIFV